MCIDESIDLLESTPIFLTDVSTVLLESTHIPLRYKLYELEDGLIS